MRSWLTPRYSNGHERCGAIHPPQGLDQDRSGSPFLEGPHFGGECVRSEDPIDVAPEDNPASEPEPDLIVTYQSRRELRNSNPKPEDLRLVVEVSDTTYDYDRTIKAALYARAAIREYWAVDVRDVNAPRLIVHLNPKDSGYRCFSHSHDEDITVLQGLTPRLKHLM